MRRFYITGVSGTGKSSITERLNEKGISAIDIDSVKDLCHWINKETKERASWHPGIDNEWHEAHGWICDKDRLVKLMDESKDVVVVAGVASNQNEFLSLFDSIFFLTCSPEVFIERINNRTNNDYGKHEVEQKRILNWHEIYKKEMIDRGAVPIDAEKPLDEVVEEIIKIIKN